MRYLRIAICFTLAAVISTAVRADDPIVIESAQLKLVEEVDVPAEQAGVLRMVHVREGALVDAGSPLAQIDDEAARLHEQRAAADLAMAERKARDRLPVEIARKSAEQSRQKLGEMRLEEQIAARQAGNVFRVEAAAKAQGVAENELQRAEKANQRYSDAVSQSEIDGRRLESEKAALEAKQSRFEQEIYGLKLDVAREAFRGQELAVGASDLEVARSEADQEVSELQASLKRHELEMARLDLSRRKIVSPLDGVVVQVYRQRGEWVEPGEPVLRVLRLNRLWAEGYIRVDDLSKCVEDAPVRLTVQLNPDEALEVEGQIVYVGREVDPINREVLIRAEIPNDNLRLLPGMEGDLVVQAKPAAKAKAAPRAAEPEPEKADSAAEIFRR
ncbi:MAG: HlyD family secretion protein [Planctomycetaceae bacterium]